MKFHTFNAVNGNNEVLKTIIISANESKMNAFKLASAKLSFAYGNQSVFLKLKYTGIKERELS